MDKSAGKNCGMTVILTAEECPELFFWQQRRSPGDQDTRKKSEPEVSFLLQIML